MNNYVLVYSYGGKYIYYLFKEEEFKVVEQGIDTKKDKKSWGLIIFFGTLMTILSRDPVMQQMSDLMFGILLIGSIIIGYILGLRGNKLKTNELLKARTINVTKRDILLHADKIEAAWDGVITMSMLCIFFVPLGLFIAYYKHNLLFQFINCALLIMYMYFIYYSNPIYIFKLVKFVRKNK